MLSGLGLENYTNIFLENNVDMNKLPTLKKEWYGALVY